MKTNTSYTPVIGLEVHVELNTKSKMFCGCANNWFGEKPNTHTCPVCLGLPGALPVPNKKAIESCIKIGLALNCTIPLISKFDRKNYFYPDLAKGYQISQFDQPFAIDGSLKLKVKNEKLKTEYEKTIRIRRAHMEEDTGKLMHETVNGEHVSLIDFNRSGVPLVEIVTEPDFESAEEVKEYLQKLQQIVRYLGVSNADMEKGEMRLEPNISLRSNTTNIKYSISNDQLPNYKVEVKNINSFSFVEKAIEYEVKRQAEILESGKIPAQETRGWDEDKHMTISQRSKEEAADYRYFPEPDIPPFVWNEKFIAELRATLPELPDEKKSRFIKEYDLSLYNAELLTRTKELADYFEEAVRVSSTVIPAQAGIQDNGSPIKSGMTIDPTKIANTIINKKIDIEKMLPAELIKQIKSTQVEDTMSSVDLEKIAQEVLSENEKSVLDYKAGKTNALMFLVGQVMKKVAGKAKAGTVRQMLEDLLK